MTVVTRTEVGYITASAKAFPYLSRPGNRNAKCATQVAGELGTLVQTDGSGPYSN